MSTSSRLEPTQQTQCSNSDSKHKRKLTWFQLEMPSSKGEIHIIPNVDYIETEIITPD